MPRRNWRLAGPKQSLMHEHTIEFVSARNSVDACYFSLSPRFHGADCVVFSAGRSLT